jgi:hypothetical protein
MLSPSPCVRRSPAWLNCLTGYEEKYTTSIFSHVLSVFSALSPARSPHPRPLTISLPASPPHPRPLSTSLPASPPLPQPLSTSLLPARLTPDPSRPFSPARSPHPRPLSARGEGRMGDSVEGFPVFSTLKEGVAGGGGRLPSGKHRLPLPLEGVCQRLRSPALRARRLWPGETRVARFPHQRLLSWHITPIFQVSGP